MCSCHRPGRCPGRCSSRYSKGSCTTRSVAPIELAVVATSPGDAYAVTEADGSFRIEGPGPRAVTHLEITHVSHDPLRIALDSVGDHSRIRIRLRGSAHQLQTVQVSNRPDALSSLLRSSQPVHVLTEEYFERNQSGTFAAALDVLPGVTSMKLGVGIAKPVIRGMSFNRVLVNNRGIKQEGQQWGADHGLEVDPFDVSTVEVIKGPATLLYGSDGLGGVINIRPAFWRKRPPRNLLTSGFQSNNRAVSNSLTAKGRRGPGCTAPERRTRTTATTPCRLIEFTYAGFVLPIYENRLKNTAGRELHYSVLAGRDTERLSSTLRFSAFNQEAGIFTGAIGLPRSYGLRHEGAHRDIDFPRQRNRHLMLVNHNRVKLGDDELELDLGVQ